MRPSSRLSARSHSSEESREEIERTYNDRIRDPSSSPRTPCSLNSPSRTPTPTLTRNPPLKLNYQPKFSLKGHRGPVSQVRFSPDGRWIASCSADATVKVWDAVTGKHMQTIEGHLAGISTIAWSPDSKTIASGSDDKTIRLWHRTTGKPYPVSLIGHHNYVYSLSFSPKGNILASGSYDEAVFLWDLRARSNLKSLPAHSDPVSAVDFIYDGTLVCSCSTDGLIRVWETSTGQCLRTLVHEDNVPVTNVCFSPNGRYILAWTLDSCIRLWDHISGTCMKTYQGHLNKKYSLGGAFGVSGSSSFIVSGSEDGKLFFWDVRNKEKVQQIEGHDGVICWVDSCIETGMVVTGGLDGVVRIWVDVNEDDDNVNGFDSLKINQFDVELDKIKNDIQLDDYNEAMLDDPLIEKNDDDPDKMDET